MMINHLEEDLFLYSLNDQVSPQSVAECLVHASDKTKCRRGTKIEKEWKKGEGTGPSEKRIACFLTCWAETLNMKIMGNGDGMQMPPLPHQFIGNWK